MRDNHASHCDFRRNPQQGLRDVFVGEAMKSIAPYTLGMKPTRDRVMVDHRSMGSMKRGLEAGDLRKRWKVNQDQTYWSEIVRQMKRRERRQSIQTSQNSLI